MSSTCGSARRWLWDISAPQALTAGRASAQAHVQACARCRAFFEENERLAGRIRESVLVAAPADLRERVYERVAAQRAGAGRLLRLAYAGALAAAVLLTVVGIWWITERDPAGVQLAALAADHARATADERFESGEARAVEEWLTTRVGYGVFVPTLSGARVVGGRVAVTELGRSAVVEYEANGRRVSYFIMEAPSATGAAAAGKVRLAGVRGYFVVQWRDRGLLHAFVGNVSAAELQKMAHECIEQSRSQTRASELAEPRVINT